MNRRIDPDRGAAGIWRSDHAVERAACVSKTFLLGLAFDGLTGGFQILTGPLTVLQPLRPAPVRTQGCGE